MLLRQQQKPVAGAEGVGRPHRAGKHRLRHSSEAKGTGTFSLSRTFLMKAETLKALSKCLVRKVPEEVTCVLNWDGADLQATGGRTFPAGAKLGQRPEDSRHPWELVASGNAPWPWVSPPWGGSKGLSSEAGIRKHLCKLLGSPRARHLSPSSPGPAASA